MVDHAAALQAAAHTAPQPASHHQVVMLEAAIHIRDLEDRILDLRTGFSLVMDQVAELVGRSAREQ